MGCKSLWLAQRSLVYGLEAAPFTLAYADIATSRQNKRACSALDFRNVKTNRVLRCIYSFIGAQFPIGVYEKTFIADR